MSQKLCKRLERLTRPATLKALDKLQAIIGHLNILVYFSTSNTEAWLIKERTDREDYVPDPATRLPCIGQVVG